MRDYIPKTCTLPKAVYYQALYAVRDYDRLRAEYDDILHASAAPPDGLPHGSGSGQPVADKAIRLNAISTKLMAIERALNTIPPEYRRGGAGQCAVPIAVSVRRLLSDMVYLPAEVFVRCRKKFAIAVTLPPRGKIKWYNGYTGCSYEHPGVPA